MKVVFCVEAVVDCLTQVTGIGQPRRFSRLIHCGQRDAPCRHVCEMCAAMETWMIEGGGTGFMLNGRGQKSSHGTEDADGWFAMRCGLSSGLLYESGSVWNNQTLSPPCGMGAPLGLKCRPVALARFGSLVTIPTRQPANRAVMVAPSPA